MKNWSVYSNHSFPNGLTTFQKFIAYIFHTQILIIFSFRVSQEYNTQVPLFVMIDLIFLTPIFEKDIPFSLLVRAPRPPWRRKCRWDGKERWSPNFLLVWAPKPPIGEDAGGIWKYSIVRLWGILSLRLEVSYTKHTTLRFTCG